MTNNSRACLLGLALLPFIAGCIDSKTTVHLKTDGSGTVRQVLYTKLPDLGPEVKVNGPGQIDQEKAKAEQAATEMGEGVTVQSVKALPDRGEWKGVEIVYAFEDVNNLKVKPMPNADAPGAPGEEPAEPQPKKDDQVKFEYADGTLVITMPPMNPAQEGGKKEDRPPVEMVQAMGALFEGMKVQLQVQVEGTITASDASFVSPSKKAVGLLQMDVGGLFGDKAAFKAMMDMEEIVDRDEIAAKLKTKPISKYLKAETKEQIEITFE
ncbi:MAG: hypothetical protein AB7O62_18790 [Pirellulales bacterium]